MNHWHSTHRGETVKEVTHKFAGFGFSVNKEQAQRMVTVDAPEVYNGEPVPGWHPGMQMPKMGPDGQPEVEEVEMTVLTLSEMGSEDAYAWLFSDEDKVPLIKALATDLPQHLKAQILAEFTGGIEVAHAMPSPPPGQGPSRAQRRAEARAAGRA